jgi:aryl-phospho-beta-D-glucosidase BglC (GH1 family)
MRVAIVMGFGLGCLEAEATAPPEQSAATSPGPRLRGFNVSRLDPKDLADAREQWGINAVRYMFPFNLLKSRDKLTLPQAWAKLMKDLPAGLDAAKKNNLAVIIALPQAGILADDSTIPSGEIQSRFWEDEENLQWIINCWKDILAICSNRDQQIWFDILNEPLNRKEMPHYPRKWPSWAQRIIDAIRTTDKIHPIVVEPGPGGLVWGFKNFPRLHGEPIIYSVHQYQPHAYTHQGIKNLQNTDLARAYTQLQRPWPDDFGEDGGYWDKARILKELEPAIQFAARNPGVRIYVGEFSVIRWAPKAAQYLRENIELFEQFGWDWTYHSFREYNGWSLENDDKYPEPGAPMPKPVEGLVSDRGKVVLEYLQRNETKK